MTQERKGEFYFHDAGICYQGWQSCASCHPGEGRSDALNWDLLNDAPEITRTPRAFSSRTSHPRP